jgi:leucine-zipper of insertion element IS481
VAHANAALTPRARLRLARLIVEQVWPVARAAERFQVAWTTGHRWSTRYRLEGEAGMGRSVQSTTSHSANDSGTGGAQDRASVLEQPWNRSRSPPASAVRPRRRICAGVGSVASPTSTGPPVSRCAATNTLLPRDPAPRRREEAGRHPRRRDWRYVGADRASATGQPRWASPATATEDRDRTGLVHTSGQAHSDQPVPAAASRGVAHPVAVQYDCLP